MEVIYRKIADIHPLPDNPRKIDLEDLERLKESIRNNPDYLEAHPLVLSDRTGELIVIDGNQRLRACQEMGWEEVPTALLHGLTEEREQEIIIRANVNNGKWDIDKLLDMIEEANDYYFPTLTAAYLKITRTLITVATVFFTPLYLLFMQNENWIPEAFEFVAVQDTVNIPLIFQFLILELSIDGLRLAAMNTPTMLSTPLSVIAGIVMGEFSVQSGWFNSEVMLYMAFVAVANYTQPNFELGYALKFMRLMLLVMTACFNLYGFIAGCILVMCFLAFNKTLSGRNYLNIKLN